MITVLLQNDLNYPDTPSKTQFQQWVSTALKQQAIQAPLHLDFVTIRIVDTTESAYLNKTFRHKEGPTNVLSFSYDSIPGEQEDSLGDLAICAALVTQEAHTQHKAIEAHWAHLTIHGLLHLLGYDHIIASDAEQMEQLEIQTLSTLGYPNPYLDEYNE